MIDRREFTRLVSTVAAGLALPRTAFALPRPQATHFTWQEVAPGADLGFLLSD